MRELLQEILPSRSKTNSRLKKRKLKSRGQSLVEIALTLPVLLVLFSGMVEMGFMLNYYLSLLDATRYAARDLSGKDPFISPNTSLVDEPAFYYFYGIIPPAQTPDYYGAAYKVWWQLAPNSATDNARKVGLNPATDDVIVSVYSVDKTGTITQYPVSDLSPTTGGDGSLFGDPFAKGTGQCPRNMGDGGFHLYCNVQASFKEANLLSQIVPGSPCQGFLVVEVAYQYHEILGLPWAEIFIGNPMLHAYTVMPLPAAAPGYSPLLVGSC